MVPKSRPRRAGQRQNWADVMEHSDRQITLIDMCGHEKYLKTTVFGLTGMLPEYALVMVRNPRPPPPPPPPGRAAC